MLHGYIEPNITHKSQTSVQKQQVKGYTSHAETSIYAENTVASIIAEAKDKQADTVGLLQKVFTVEVIDL